MFNMADGHQGRVRLPLTATVGDLKRAISNTYSINSSTLEVSDSQGRKYDDHVPIMEVLDNCYQRLPYVIQTLQRKHFVVRFVLDLEGQSKQLGEIEATDDWRVSDLRKYIEKDYPGRQIEIRLMLDDSNVETKSLSEQEVLSSVTRRGQYQLLVKEIHKIASVIPHRNYQHTTFNNYLGVGGSHIGLDIPGDASVDEVIDIIRDKYKFGPIMIIIQGRLLDGNDILWDKIVEYGYERPTITPKMYNAPMKSPRNYNPSQDE